MIRTVPQLSILNSYDTILGDKCAIDGISCEHTVKREGKAKEKLVFGVQ